MRKYIALYLLVVCSLTGCAENQITGKVVYEGKPVTIGTVVFVGTDNAPRTAVLDPDGTFLVKGVPPSAARIAVTSYNPGKMDPEFEADVKDKFTKLGIELPAPQDFSKWFPIPKVYANWETSDLKADINSGTTDVKVQLTKK